MTRERADEKKRSYMQHLIAQIYESNDSGGSDFALPVIAVDHAGEALVHPGYLSAIREDLAAGYLPIEPRCADVEATALVRVSEILRVMEDLWPNHKTTCYLRAE